MARWKVDTAHTLVEFSVRHMMFTTVKGRFTRFEGVLEGDLEDLSTARIEGTIDAASVDTAEAQRDDHLRSPDFFDVENHPTLTFVSRQIEPVGERKYRMIGDLTIRGVTREVEFDLTYTGSGKDPWGNKRAGFTAEAEINRKDFGLRWNAPLEFGGFLVGDNVKISIEAQLIREEGQAA